MGLLLLYQPPGLTSTFIILSGIQAYVIISWEYRDNIWTQGREWNRMMDKETS
jgi:hypothetical protein